MSLKLLVMDVDGTLTDGKIYITAKGEAFKSFDVKDGYGIKNILHNIGMKSAIITGRVSEIVERRAQELEVDWVYQGVSDKRECLQNLMDEHGYAKEEVMYVGDDLNDLECMQMAGYSCCPADAHEIIKEAADYVASRCGGSGAIREIIDNVIR
ncbi:HAD-IIIA family hydrolase [Lachnospiraceae bacterium 64-25]